MRVLTVILLFLLAVGVTLFVMGVFTPAPEPTSTGSGEERPTTEGTDGGLKSAEPTDEPPPELPRIDKPLHVLLVARWRDRFNAFLEQTFEGQELIVFRSHVQDLKPGERAGASKGQTPLADAPGPETLEGVDVVILDEIDPTRIPATFFEALAERVRNRSVGLLAMTGLMGGGMLDQPSLQGLLPVAKARKIEGEPIPGVSFEEAPFFVTAAGAEHRASRIVPFKGWSERIWGAQRLGEKAWGTKFTYPVEEVKPGAVVLLEVDVSRQGRIAALIQGAPAEGRVLWVGFPDFGEAFWRDPKMTQRAAALQLQWVTWLAGR